MIAALRVLNALEVFVQILLREKCRPVDTLQLRILLVAQPVRARKAHHLERLHAAGRGHVRPAAEIHEPAVAIQRNLVAGLREFLHEMHLHKVIAGFECLQTLLTRLQFADEFLVARRHFRHAALDQLQVLGRERRRSPKIVEEPRIRRRSVAQLRLRKQLRNGGRHHVRRGVAQNLQRIRVPLCQQLQRDVLLERRGQIDQALGVGVFRAIHRRLAALGRGGCNGGRLQGPDTRNHRSLRQARRDALGDGQRCRAGRDLAHRSVGKLNLYRTHKSRVTGLARRVQITNGFVTRSAAWSSHFFCYRLPAT